MVGETAEETQAFQPRSPDGENCLPQHSPGEGLAPHLTPRGLSGNVYLEDRLRLVQESFLQAEQTHKE